jgi:hypothetical protein
VPPGGAGRAEGPSLLLLLLLPAGELRWPFLCLCWVCFPRVLGDFHGFSAASGLWPWGFELAVVSPEHGRAGRTHVAMCVSDLFPMGFLRDLGCVCANLSSSAGGSVWTS